MNKKVGQLQLIKKTKLNYNNYLLEFKADTILSDIKPGQFINIQIERSPSTFLRRPFSIYNVNYQAGTISIVVKIAGAGSEMLTSAEPGSIIDMVYPLGNGFSQPKAGDKCLLVGGGVGVAPLYLLAKEMNINGIKPFILLGARTAEDHILLSEFNKLGEVFLTTNDGSLQRKGFVTDHEIWSNSLNFNKIYCCGPEPMMKAVAAKAAKLNIDCEVSLENLMACGFGVCLCCVTKTHDGHKCVCTEGPVFNIKDLEWQI